MNVFTKTSFLTLILSLNFLYAQESKPTIKELKNRLIQKTLTEQNLKTQDIKPANPQPILPQPTVQQLQINTPPQVPVSQSIAPPTTTNPQVPTNIQKTMNVESKISFPNLELDSFLQNPLTTQISKALDQWKLSWDANGYRFECRWIILGSVNNINQNFTSQLIQSRWWYVLGGKPKSPILDKNRGELTWEFQWKDENKGIFNHYLTLVYKSSQPLKTSQIQKLSKYLPENLATQPTGTIEQNQD